MVVGGQPWHILHETPSLKDPEQNGLEKWLKQYSACFVSMKSTVQIPDPREKKNYKRAGIKAMCYQC
jgi:hypothetical protein